MTPEPALQTSSNTHIAQYLTKQRQRDNEIWSINTTLQEKYFSSKIMWKIRVTSSRPFFIF